MARRSDHTRDELREMALQAAESIVEEHGIEGLTARKIAARIGYTVGSLYLIFRNLDELVLNVNARTLDELYETLEAAAARCRQPRRCLLTLAHTYIDFVSNNTSRWKLLFLHPMPAQEPLPQWYTERFEHIFDLVATHLEPLAGRRSRKKIGLAAQALWGGVHGICALSIHQFGDGLARQPVRATTDSLIEHYLAGFSGG